MRTGELKTLPVLLAGSIAVAALAAGCIGEITEPGGSGSGGPNGNGTSKQPICTSKEISPGDAPLRRMSNAEYRNTIADLFGNESLAASATENFVPEVESLGFRNNARFLQVSGPVANAFMDAAEMIATAVSPDPAILPCTPQSGSEKTCATEFIQSFGQKVYRRPLTTDEVTAYEAVYDKGFTESGFKEGVNWVVYTMLQSPHFLYRVEFGNPADGKKVTRLTDWEMASRLSYMLFQSMPDDELFAAAGAGELRTSEQIEAQGRRMLKDPKAHRVVEFFEQWLDTDQLPAIQRDSDVFPEFNSSLPDLMREETRAFVDHVLFEEDASLTTLMTAPYSFLNSTLAKHYGVSGPSGSEFEKVDMAGRSGLLTMGGAMTVHDRPNRTSIVLRGLKIRTDWLCQTVGAPPNDVIPVLKDLGPNVSQRDRLAQHSEDPTCAACHTRIDPLGLVLEGFDALGRPRTKDEWGAPVITTGNVSETLDSDGPVADPVELAHRLATSREVRECFATHTFRFFYGRADTTADGCSKQKIYTSFEKNDLSVTELLVALTQTDAFLYRPVIAGAP